MVIFTIFQGEGSTTFSRPPSDPRSTILEAIEHHSKNSTHHPMFVYYDEHKQERRVMTWGDVCKYIANAVHLIGQLLKDDSSGYDSPPVVGILASTSSIVYSILILSLVRAGYSPFPISPRNSSAAIANLLATTKAMYLISSQDTRTQNLIDGIDIKAIGTTVVPVLLWKDILEVEVEHVLPSATLLKDPPQFIVHSSGSTSFPKPIFMRPMNGYGYNTYYGDIDVCGKVISGHGIPIFHGMGISMILWAAFSGITVALFPPGDFPFIPTSQRVLESASALQADMLFCAPSFLESWAQNESDIERLKKMTHVLFGGGPLPEETGRKLSSAGVNVITLYGTTEVGAISKIFVAGGSKEEWRYVEPSILVSLVFEPVEDMDGIFKLIILDTDNNRLAAVNTMYNGVPAYDTNDLVVLHPENPRLFRVYGRYDDQIMHSNGEKTNPGPIEQILVQHPDIQSAVMFGRARSHAGVIITPSTPVDPANVSLCDEYKIQIWDAIERGNNYAPSHSKIFKEMIIIANPSKPFQFTSKGTLRRARILVDYNKEIEQTYAKFDTPLSPPSTSDKDEFGVLNIENTTQSIRSIAHQFIDPKLTDTDDFFNAGADSLSANRMRNAVIDMLASTHFVPTSVLRDLPSDFIFTFSSVYQLSALIHGLLLGLHYSGNNKASGAREVEQEMPSVLVENSMNTIVKFKNPVAKEAPLIMIHGGGGHIYDLFLMQANFRTGFWAIQVTHETPVSNLEEQTKFYLNKIKESQPHGPYRIGGYSASSIIACNLALLLEKQGDIVEQLVLLDHFPALFLAPRDDFDINTFDPADTASIEEYLKLSLTGLCAMFAKDNVPRRQKLAIEVMDAFYGRPTSELATMLNSTMQRSMRSILGFIASLAPSPTNGEKMLRALLQWISDVEAPVDIYLASHGVAESVPKDDANWEDVGITRAFPKARIIRVEGNHFDIVANLAVTTDIQRGYI